MAASGQAQERLDRIVKVVAANLVAEVCSVYLRRAGDVLELWATEGLNPSAVHHTRLRVGEGLVGTIAALARPLNLADAQSHPDFAFRPETGEEIYHSLLGVPVLREGRVIGTLAVQNRTMRRYSDDEVDALQTVAMVIAEIAVADGLVRADVLLGPDASEDRPHRFDGIAMADGAAVGVAVMHQPRVEITRLISDDPAGEQRRLSTAVGELRRSLDELMAATDVSHGGEHRDILEAFRMFADDRGWTKRMNEAIASGLTAEAAVRRVQNDTVARFSDMSDSYLRQRASDFDDLANRLLRILAGRAATAAGESLPADAVVVARALGPAELLDYDRARLRAVVLEEGTPNSHVAIVGRALGIPMVGEIESVRTRIQAGDTIIVDGDSGRITARPDPDTLRQFEAERATRLERLARYEAIRDRPARTLDGTPVGLYMNAGLPIDLPNLKASGADGIGLFRTELPFMVSGEVPELAAQVRIYSEVLEAAAGRPVVFRTLDIGGDKPVLHDAIRPRHEANPAMGWRAIRIGLDVPDLLETQIRALLLAAHGRELSIMFPMIGEVAELRGGRAIVENELARLRRLSEPVPERVRIGAMIEVPAVAWQVDALLPFVDFVSIGSNDLLQFFFASDRSNPVLAGRYDPLSPGVLSMVGRIADRCDRAGVPVTLCGEMAGRPLEAMALIGVGLRHLSMPASAIGAVKAMVLSLDVDALKDRVGLQPEVLVGNPARTLRDDLVKFAHECGIAI
jgi:phosphotransferase system enzyme I (PtsP)